MVNMTHIPKTLTVDPQTVHIFCASLSISEQEEQDFRSLLSWNEIERADRFYFPIHRRRFIAARGILRTLLGQYLSMTPQAIHFLYSKHHKPYLAASDLQFNVSHSHEMAVFAFTRTYPIGVDIEKIESTFMSAVAKRYFSEKEVEQLMALSDAEQIPAFYQIWSRKEAFVKAIGAGLHFPLKAFSVSLTQQVEQLPFEHEAYREWHIEGFNAHPDYQAAFVTPQPVNQVFYWDWLASGSVSRA